MATTFDELRANIELAMQPSFREKLLAKGQSRAMIWRDGVLPDDAPEYSPLLSEDLLSFGYSLLLHILRFKELGGEWIKENVSIRDAFEIAAEAIEAVVANGEDNGDRGFHRLVVASAYHLGRFSARAYSILSAGIQGQNLSLIEEALAKILLRDLDGLHHDCQQWMQKEGVDDALLLEPLLSTAGKNVDDDDSDEVDAITEVIVRAVDDNFMKAIAQSISALERGQYWFIQRAKEKLEDGKAIAAQEGLVPQWWIHRLAIHLIDGLWNTSFHKVLPTYGPEAEGGTRWSELRKLFISSLYKRARSEVELWPSQLEAAARVLEFDTNLVLSLPTSAGKTRIAELCILSCLSEHKRVVFVTPLRALSAQTEVSLQRTFAPLGAKVSSLYGAIGATGADVDSLKTSDIVVATPEKLDFALRSSPNLLDDVGLIVLDEGHMIGLSEREIRYEAQIQRLLRRADARQRRIVCLSAILPDGEQLEDFTDWLTFDKPGGLIKNSWRPTRLRFGEVVWNKASTSAKLEISVGEPNPFVPGFVTGKKPTKGRATKLFPSNQREFCLAIAWKLMDEGQTVLIFCPLRKSVLPFAKSIIDMAKRGHIDSVLRAPASELETALAVGAEWFGKGHYILECLQMGIAVHHGELPTPYRKEIERLLRDGILRLTISSPTLAQGLNLAATSLLFHSLSRSRDLIDVSEFRNVVGRAGRAYVDIEGLVLYPMFEPDWKKKKDWAELIQSDKSREMESGLLRLLMSLLLRMANKLGTRDVGKLLEYVAGQGAWEFPAIASESAEENANEAKRWESHLASLDTAIFSLLGDADTPADDVESAIETVLESSLLMRRLKRRKDQTEKVLLGGLITRAKYIWKNSDATRRRAYFLAGVGFSTGQALDVVATELEAHLIAANQAIAEGDSSMAVVAIESFARMAFLISPFIPSKLPENWSAALRGWLNGLPLHRLVVSDVDDSDEEVGDSQDVSASLVEHAFAYNLCWAMEAVRVRAAAHEDPFSEEIQLSQFPMAHAVAAVETGTLNIAAMMLIKAGFKSRLGAIAAVNSTDADFSTKSGMEKWLTSIEVAVQADDDTWPTPESRILWLEFIAAKKTEQTSSWSAKTYTGPVRWSGQPPLPESPLFIGGGAGKERSIYSEAFEEIGEILWSPNTELKGITIASAIADASKIQFEYIGPEAKVTSN